MLLTIFAVFDSCSGTFTTPFFLPKNQMAIREFTDAINNPNSQFHKHPEDYNLHVIGTFDNTCGLVLNLEVDEIIAKGLSSVIPNNEANKNANSHENQLRPDS